VLKVHVFGDQGWEEPFRQELAGVAECSFGNEIPREVDVLVKGTPTAEELRGVHHVVVPFAGIPGATRELLSTNPQIKLYNLHHNSADTAEMAMALYFAVARKLVVRDRNLREGKWSEGSFMRGGSADSVRAAGKHALVLGYGAIGRRIANVCRAMEMTVSAVRRSGPFDCEIHSIQELDELLPTADSLFVALPLTPETEGLLSAERLALLPPNCIISNIARGRIFNEEAMFNWLKANPSAGAGIDVWWNYPKADEPCLPSNFPFQELPNVVMTPHVGGSSHASEEDRWRALAHLVREIANGSAKPASAELGY
jgi:phosphoglycerate dehydrogenase-like enzyme